MNVQGDFEKLTSGQKDKIKRFLPSGSTLLSVNFGHFTDKKLRKEQTYQEMKIVFAMGNEKYTTVFSGK